MSILVVCTGCKKSFQVSDKFAGKTGPCPNCKTVIRVPEKAEEVKVHAPTQFASGGRTATGQLATRPIGRKRVQFDPVKAAIVAGASLGVLLVAGLGNYLGLFRYIVAVAVGLLVVSPPLVVAAYMFLHDDEDLAPYRGEQLYLRAAACAAGYVLLWGFFAYVVAGSGLPLDEIWVWVFLAPALLCVGALLPMAALDLDFGNGFFHYTFYVLVTTVLGWAAGLGFPWSLPEQ